MSAATIDGVLAQREEIVSRTSRLGFFAALYRKVTERVKEGIRAGRFEDGPLMERLDVVFANRYLDAYAAWQAGRPVAVSWRAAFAAASRSDLAVLQHLLLGMNAHIYLDLGIAAAEVPVSRRDFDEINDVLLELLDEVQEAISRVSPWLDLLDWVGGSDDEAVAGFALILARNLAWRHAETLLFASDDRESIIVQMDITGEAMSGALLRPPFLTRMALRVIAAREPSDPAVVLAALS
jgi:hypothetical protein